MEEISKNTFLSYYACYDIDLPLEIYDTTKFFRTSTKGFLSCEFSNETCYVKCAFGQQWLKSLRELEAFCFELGIRVISFETKNMKIKRIAGFEGYGVDQIKLSKDIQQN